MARKLRIILLYVVVSFVFFVSVYYHYLRNSLPFFVTTTTITNITTYSNTIQQNFNIFNNSIKNNNTIDVNQQKKKKEKSIFPEVIIVSEFETVSVLLPDWEVLVIVSPEDTQRLLYSLRGHDHDFVCVHYTTEVTPARLSGNFTFPDRVTFRCHLPVRARKRLPFKQPVLRRLPDESPVTFVKSRILLIWSNLLYDALTPDDDENMVIVFAKGLIKKQDIVRDPSEFQCIFGDEINGVRTDVKTSMLEVFRCERPNLKDVSISVSLEIISERRVVPSVAYYTPTPRKLDSLVNKKSLLCACTMVYNVAKFLKEWVYYHSRIGVERFILYDNGSDDDLENVVIELNQEGYHVDTYFWLWQKTQEAGFSHSAVYAKGSCMWMMYLDVDEFVYSPKWSSSKTPSVSMLQSLVKKHGYDGVKLSNANGGHYLFDHSSVFDTSMSSEKLDLPVPHNAVVGQISIGCHEFGPSNQRVHPVMGVTQGYNCRMEAQNRHKSIVLLEAIDDSLHNVIHHFKLKKGYRSIMLSPRRMMVNHYKYQAWPEFKAKFRRRVSAYVVDWSLAVNLKSQDRPKGLGASTIEPQNWTTSYCEIYDDRLRDLVRRWFGTKSPSGYHMPWQR
ncbi:hypothetical protein Leryth_000691 [Lithospermum erythrorhizon]|nr:hypothetical protein Leryth_000691 [Lithospermum erythrorhizon]